MESWTASADASPKPGFGAGAMPTKARRVTQAPALEPRRSNFRSRTGWLLAALLLLLAIVSILSGCGGGSEVENLLSSGPTVFDTDARSAKIVAVSKLPIICVVAYGPNTNYGLTSTDTVMTREGGGHTDHHHVLLGLKSETEYHFRFSAIGPRGEGYRSKDYTFRTLPD